LFKEKIEFFLQNPDERKKIVDNAHNLVSKEYTFRDNASIVLAWFTSA